MKKRMIAMALTLAMLISFLPVSIGAENDAPASHNAHACKHCSVDDVQWTVWDGATALVPGHYCLAQGVTLQSTVQLTEGEYVICLNGQTINGGTAGRIFDLSGTAALTVMDCTGKGMLTGATNSAVALAGSAVFNLHGCTVKGNSAAVASAIYATGDAKVNITGATITGNTANKSSTIWGQNNVQITVADSAITRNESRGSNSAHTAGIYIMGSAKLTVSGVSVIDGNSSAAGAPDVMMAAATCDTLYVNELKAGSKITFKTAATNPQTAAEVITVAENGTQNDWGCSWVTHISKSGAANGISYIPDGNSKTFVFGHYHGSTAYEAMSSLPANFNASHNGKHYYLTNDVTLTKAVAVWKSTNVTLCLNGHDIKQTGSGVRIFGFADSGNTFTIEDCSGYYDEKTETYMSGGLTSTTTVKTGSVVNVARGNTFIMNGGKIYGTTNTAEDGSPVYVTASDNTSVATFIMNGGAICSNNSVSGAVYVAAGAGNGSVVDINGGYFYKNNSTKTAGAIYIDGRSRVAVSNAVITNNTAKAASAINVIGTGTSVTIENSTITNNTATAGYGAVNIAKGTPTVMLVGSTVIDNNTGAGVEQNVHLQENESVVDVSGLTQGASVGFSVPSTRIANGYMHLSTALNGADPTAYCFSDSADYVDKIKEDRLVLAGEHEHCLYGEKDCNHDMVGWSAWEKTTELPTIAGNYYLKQNVQLNGVWEVSGNIKLCLNGHTVTQTAENTRVISVQKTGHLTISDCKDACGAITGGSNALGAGVWVARGGGVFNMYGGKITDNAFTGDGASSGGAVYLQSGQEGKAGGVFNMYGGEISGNAATMGGAVYLHSESAAKRGDAPAQFNLFGGKITGNEATNGGAVYANGDAAVTLAGGTVTGNTATANGGGVYAAADATISLQGSPVVIGNTVDEKANNLYLYGDAVMQVGTLGTNAKVGISAETAPRAISNAQTEDCVAYFTSDSVYRVLKMQDGKLYIAISGEHQHCLCASGAVADCKHDTQVWSAWESTTGLPTESGNYYLLGDVKLTGPGITSSNADINICLNGHTVTAPEGQRILTVTASADVCITDCAKTSGSLTGGSNTYGGAVSVHRGCSFSLYGGKLTGNTAEEGGAVYLQQGNGTQAGGIFHMYGGEISKNTAAFGGAIRVSGSGQFVQYGGTVKENTATKYGGGIYASNAAVVNLQGGTVAANTTEGNGGGVFVSGEGTLVTVGGTTISGNTAYAGGGVMAQKGATVAICSGAITENTATSSGAGVFTNSDVIVTMTGGSISKNKATNSGGGLYLITSDCTFSGGTIESNRAEKGGAGLWASGAKLTLSGTAITGNVTGSNGNGGGVAVGRAVIGDAIYYSEVTMTGGQINGNTARAGGGVLLQNGSKLHMENGTIDGNTATASGAGVFANDQVVLTMTGGSISKNKAANSGGGLYLLTSETTFGGGKIASNYAGKNGGGIWSAGSKMTISGTSIKNNATEKSGIAGGVGVASAGTVYSVLTMTAGEISANTARAGAGILLQPNTVLNLKGGQISHNVASASGGGIFASNDSTINMTGGGISYNECTNHGAGVYQMKATGNFSGGEISHNTAVGSGGGLMVTGAGMVVNLKGTKVYENTARNGGGLVVQGAATLNVDGSELYKNTVTAYGGGLYLSTKSFFNMKSGKFYENQSGMGGGAIFAAITSTAAMTGGTIANNTTEGDGGGIVARGNFSITDVTVSGNRAAANGGGIATGKMGAGGWGIQPGLVMENTKVEGNTADALGGGIYLSIGSRSTLRSSTITDNRSGGEGGGLWAIDDLTMQDLTVTNNTSGAEGYGVYLAASRYDDHSYFTGLMKMSGDMRICDNAEGDLYLGEMTALVIDAAGLGQNAKVNITLDSGVLTSRVYGPYNYEGGNCVYTITQGDRSLTDPEAVPVTEETQQSQDKSADVLLYVGVGVFVIAIVAVAAVLMLKKKAGKAAEETTKD